MADDPAEMPADDVMPCAHELMEVLQRHMASRVPSKLNVFVSLNALAIVSASVLCGTVSGAGETPSPNAMRFFNDAMSRQCREMTGGDGGTLNG